MPNSQLTKRFKIYRRNFFKKSSKMYNEQHKIY